MKRNGFKVLFALASLVAVAAAIQDFRLDKSITQAHASMTAVDHEVAALSVALSDLRAGQTGYLAAGQEQAAQMQRVSDLAGQMDTGLDHLKSLVGSPSAAGHVETAATSLAELMSLDKRARTALQAEQRFVASDLIFGDSAAPTQAASNALAAVRTSNGEAADAAVSWQSTQRLILIPLSLMIVLVSAFLAGRSSREPESTPATIADMLRDLPPPVKTGTQSVKAAPPAAPAPPAVPTVNLTDAAELCVDLARVMDARDMQTLLERTANVLGASGLILWVVNTEGTKLLPVLTHGYSERVLLKLSALEVNADNVTSLSYRSVRPQTMLGSGPGSASAIAVPLVTAGGCNGVLAAEVYDTRPSPEFIALSRVIAAQFATMINPCETQPAHTAAQA